MQRFLPSKFIFSSSPLGWAMPQNWNRAEQWRRHVARLEKRATAAVALQALRLDTLCLMCQYFLNNDAVYNASDDAYIVLLAFLAFVNVYIEYSFESLSRWHPPCMVSFVRLLLSFVNQSWTILPPLRCSNLSLKIFEFSINEQIWSDIAIMLHNADVV